MTKGKLKKKKKEDLAACYAYLIPFRCNVGDRLVPDTCLFWTCYSLWTGENVLNPRPSVENSKLFSDCPPRLLRVCPLAGQMFFPGGRCLEQTVLARSWPAAGVTSRDLSVWLGQSSVVPREPPRASGSSETTVGDALLSPQSRAPGATSPAGGFVFSSLPCPPMLLWCSLGFEGMWLAPQLLALLLA